MYVFLTESEREMKTEEKANKKESNRWDQSEEKECRVKNVKWIWPSGKHMSKIYFFNINDSRWHRHTALQSDIIGWGDVWGR